MKLRFDWKKIVIFTIVSGGLIVLTDSFLMSLGIILLLFVVDNLLAEWERKQKNKNDREKSGE